MLPKSGRNLPPVPSGFSQSAYAEAIASSLVADLGPTHLATKTVMGWTGASERSARHWLHGDYGPDGRHLILLASNSDSVLKTFLRLADRDGVELALELAAARAALTRATAIIDALGSKPAR